MASFYRAYSQALIRRPYITQSATAFCLFGGGDVIAQQIIEKKGKNHDLARTARLGFYGGALFAPPITKWFQFLGRLKFSSPTKAVIYRTWLDQSLMAPLAVGWFFTSMAILEGKGFGGAVNRMQSAYVPTLIRNWGVFVPAQIINFAVVPPQLRFAFIGVVSLFWNTYLSAVNAQQQHPEPLPDLVPVEKLPVTVA
ncbi:hypothetical protein EVG20_g8532 [Dentipellis fragilis]|uniref:Protein SYM1 n=1 Tax=Dentipellis fragilis TaxID=205917 RepID=A0A4Y9Y4Q7_9AGAM|nr:hypothetical protein EVG20_g8532 [Dentipellis fragilis]